MIRGQEQQQKQDMEHKRMQAAAAIVRLGVKPWHAWEAVIAAEKTREREKETLQ